MSDTQMDSQHFSVCDGEANAVDDLFPRFGFVSFSNTHLLNFSSGLRSIHEHYTPNEEWKLWRRFMDPPHRVSLSILDFPRCLRRRNRFGCGEDRRDTVTTIGRLTDMSIPASVLVYVLRTGLSFATSMRLYLNLEYLTYCHPCFAMFGLDVA